MQQPHFLKTSLYSSFAPTSARLFVRPASPWISDGIIISKKEATIREAEGQAQAILAVQKANAEGIRMVNEASPSKAVIQLKSLEAFAKAADGKATKIIIPSEILLHRILDRSRRDNIFKLNAVDLDPPRVSSGYSPRGG
mgnify:CR=1 FL=1